MSLTVQQIYTSTCTYINEKEPQLTGLNRSERQDMPMVFKAPNTYSNEEIYESGDGDSRGFYEDGAYVARGSLGPQLPEAEKVDVEAQEAFTKALKQRFLKQRDQMHLSPAPDALAALDERHPISFPEKSNKAYAEWRRLVRTSVPQPAQIQAMQQPEIFRLVELIHKHYLVRETEIPRNVSTWIWSLLARLGDVGAMDNDQVWMMRQLGRKAVLVQVSFNDSAAAEELERVAAQEITERRLSDGLAPRPPEKSSKELATLRNSDAPTADDTGSQATKSDEVSKTRQNTLATLDMIIVLVGEVFGQRDLLDFRQPWKDQTEELHEE